MAIAKLASLRTLSAERPPGTPDVPEIPFYQPDPGSKPMRTITGTGWVLRRRDRPSRTNAPMTVENSPALDARHSSPEFWIGGLFSIRIRGE
jgi:hypothetical protein